MCNELTKQQTEKKKRIFHRRGKNTRIKHKKNSEK